jgi:hypothetical protein
VSAGVYLAQGARDRLVLADTKLNQHLAGTPGGLCAVCLESEPCRARYEALRVFDQYGVLPRRRPGLAGASAVRGQSFDGFAEPQTRSNDSV